jgi:hypothetical protein
VELLLNLSSAFVVAPGGRSKENEACGSCLRIGALVWDHYVLRFHQSMRIQGVNGGRELTDILRRPIEGAAICGDSEAGRHAEG